MARVFPDVINGRPGAVDGGPRSPGPIEGCTLSVKQLSNIRWEAIGSPASLAYMLSMAAAVMVALAFPLPGWSGLAWIGPGLLWLANLGSNPGQAFRTGTAAGFLHFLISLSWLLNMPFPAGAVAAWISLSAYCGLYWGLWSWISVALTSQFQKPASVTPIITHRWIEAAQRWVAAGGMNRFRVSVLLGCAWVTLEIVRGRLMSGFPWNCLGITQWRNAPLIQISSVTGVYGVSFLVCWCSIAITSALVLVAIQPRNRFAWLAEARVPLIVLVIITGLGFRRILALTAHESDLPHLSLALVQPSIPQEILWDKSQTSARFEKIYRLSSQALAVRPDVLVWPEGCLDLDGPDPFYRMLGLVTNAPASWILGSEDVTRDSSGKEHYFNGAWVFDSSGKNSAKYHKQRLVIFGEFVPLAKWLPFLKWLTPIGGGFDAGTDPGRFPVVLQSAESTNPPVTALLSPVICFEDIFPHGTRDQVQQDTDLLIELTNDGWFSNSSAQWQHCANAAFRSVENGVPLVRCANNGITCWLDSVGRFRDRVGSTSEEAYAPLASAGTPRSLTFYRDHGDFFAWTCCGLSLFAIAPTATNELRRRFRKVEVSPMVE